MSPNEKSQYRSQIWALVLPQLDGDRMFCHQVSQCVDPLAISTIVASLCAVMRNANAPDWLLSTQELDLFSELLNRGNRDDFPGLKHAISCYRSLKSNWSKVTTRAPSSQKKPKISEHEKAAIRRQSFLAAAPHLERNSIFISQLSSMGGYRPKGLVPSLRKAIRKTYSGKWPWPWGGDTRQVLISSFLACDFEGFPNLKRAVSECRLNKQETRNAADSASDSNSDEEGMMSRDDLDCKDEWTLRRKIRLDNTPQRFLHRLDEAYPPIGVWIAGNAQIASHWDDKAKRMGCSIHVLQPDRLQMTVDENESARICDPEGNLVALVLRNFCPEDRVIDRVLKLAAKIGNSPLLVGDVAILDEMQFKCKGDTNNALSIVMTFWELCRTWLPDTIVSEIHSICRYRHITGYSKAYLPKGTLSKNHSSAIVRDRRPPAWMVSWILNRSFNNDQGGALYLSDYGLRVKAARNTLIAWRPLDAHGIGLFDIRQWQNDPLQFGLTIGPLDQLCSSRTLDAQQRKKLKKESRRFQP